MVALPKAPPPPPPPPGVVEEPQHYIVVPPRETTLSDLIAHCRFPYTQVLKALLVTTAFSANWYFLVTWFRAAHGDGVALPIVCSIICAFVWLCVSVSSSRQFLELFRQLWDRYVNGTVAECWLGPNTGELRLHWQHGQPPKSIPGAIVIRLRVTGIWKRRVAILSVSGWLQHALRHWTVRLVNMNVNAVFVNVADGTNRLCLEVRDLLALLQEHVVVVDHPDRLDLAAIVSGISRAHIEQQQRTATYRDRLDAWSADENAAEVILIDLLDDILRTRRYVKSREGLRVLADALGRYVAFLTDRGDPSRRHYDRLRSEAVTELATLDSQPATAAARRQS